VPPLIFESALNLDNRVLLKTLTPALILAGPGLLVSALIVGGSLAWLTPLSLGGALVFGALISATDPVAVIALFKDFGVPKRLTMLVEGESMLNDATAIVLFDLVLAAWPPASSGWIRLSRLRSTFSSSWAAGCWWGGDRHHHGLLHRPGSPQSADSDDRHHRRGLCLIHCGRPLLPRFGRNLR
jgi:NhaP-type Na+/H+ or K+/H+ antiporter